MSKFFLLFLLPLFVLAYFPPNPRCDEVLINEDFSTPTLSPNWNWFNEPKTWSISSKKLIVEPDSETDFWSRSYYEFIHDNGHFLYMNLSNSENYTIYTKVNVSPVHLFDQGGLMARYRTDSWIKMGAEYGDNSTSQLGGVVTNYYSDWATRDIPSQIRTFQYRMTKIGMAWVLHVKLNEEENWEQMRVGYLEGMANSKEVSVGIFACSPTQAGMRVEFDYIKICKFNSSATSFKHKEL